MLAINLHPGETVQPWHFDDGGVKIPRPRPALGIWTFWAIDDTTEQNGATEIIPGSHLWDGQNIEGALQPAHFQPREPTRDGNRPDAVKLTMPSGSLAITKGTLWHRGGANRSDRPRLIITPQYCVGWVAATREHGARRSCRAGGPIARTRPRTDRLFDPSAVHGLCRRRSSRGACCGRTDRCKGTATSPRLTPRRSQTSLRPAPPHRTRYPHSPSVQRR